MNLLTVGIINLVFALLMIYTIWLNFDNKSHARKVLEFCIMVICFLIAINRIGDYVIKDVERAWINPRFEKLTVVIDWINAALTILSLIDNINIYRKRKQKEHAKEIL